MSDFRSIRKKGRARRTLAHFSCVVLSAWLERATSTSMLPFTPTTIQKVTLGVILSCVRPDEGGSDPDPAGTPYARGPGIAHGRRLLFDNAARRSCSRGRSADAVPGYINRRPG